MSFCSRGLALRALFLRLNPVDQDGFSRANICPDPEMRDAAARGLMIHAAALLFIAEKKLGDGVRAIEDIARKRAGRE